MLTLRQDVFLKLPSRFNIVESAIYIKMDLAAKPQSFGIIGVKVKKFDTEQMVVIQLSFYYLNMKATERGGTDEKAYSEFGISADKEMDS